MIEQPTTAAEKSFLWGLAHAALNPGLRSVLLFDATPTALRASALALAHMLTITTGKTVKVVQLSSTDTEETLWGSFSLAPGESLGESGPIARWRPGVLVPEQDERALRLVLIPDLARLSLAARRACITLIGADVASLDRHGKHAEWNPDMCWIASCAMSDMGKVTLHLRDRFALRIDAQPLGQHARTANKAAALLSWIARQDAAQDTPGDMAHRPVESGSPLIDWPGYQPPQPTDSLLPTDLGARLRAAASRPWPTTTPEAIARLNDCIASHERYHPRGELTLARLAVAHARLWGAEQVLPGHVDKAARMLKKTLAAPLPPPHPSEPPAQRERPARRKKSGKASLPQEPEPYDSSIAADDPSLEEGEQFEPAPFAEDPFPDLRIAIEHEWESLRLPAGREQPIQATRGAVIGAEPSHTLHDVAIAATLLEAAKYQVIRRKNTASSGHTLLLSPSDIHRYRRASIETFLLVLVIDFTSLGPQQRVDEMDEIIAQLIWAYQKRAAISLIRVGAAHIETARALAHAELRAERSPESNILSPRFEDALCASAGRATPLAHGLDLALQALRFTAQQGAGHVEEARLVVLTDGRGNVPLNDSRAGRIPEHINREGIEDALRVAHQIAGLRHVQSLVFDPQPRFLANLPEQFASALGAELIKIPLDTAPAEDAAKAQVGV